MIINTGWLKKYIDIPFKTDELAEKLTFSGLETKPVRTIDARLQAVQVAEILQIKPHPNSDHLTLCTVTNGNEQITVVCGAPNVKVGQKVPLALAGTTLPNGLKLQKVRIRGVESAGMLCAEDELGLSADHSGIMVLPADTPVGISLFDYLEKAEQSLEVELTPNRPDCASHIGVAREISLLTGGDLKIPVIHLREGKELTDRYIKVTIADPEACPRYAARLVKNVTIGPSPEWLVAALESIGLRSINNVVDAANYVLMETGHPLHTFDYAQIRGQQIIVRKAQPGEIVTTLDGIERRLSPDILLICDAERPVAIAGIMGLANSEINAGTRDVLIESAYFQPQTIRKGSKFLGLQTDASYRFERGADIEGLIYALNRVADLIVTVAGGEICQGIVDAYPRPYQPSQVQIRFAKIDALIGNHYEPQRVIWLLKKLGCQILNQDNESVEVMPPSWRPDLEREVDFIEEVLRINGMNAVPLTPKLPVHPMITTNQRYEQIEKLRNLMVACGYYEHFSNSLVSADDTQFTLRPVKAVKLRNPLSQEMAYLRTAIVPGLIAAAKRNINRRQTNLQLFELGYVQEADDAAETMTREYLHLGVLVSGLWEEQHWSYPARKADFFTLKGLLEEIGRCFGIRAITFQETEHALMQNLVTATVEGELIAWLGQVEPRYQQQKWDIEQPLWVMEVDAEVLLRHAQFATRFQELPVYPTVERDISIVVERDLPVATVAAKIGQQGGNLLRKIKFYDLYSGKNIDNDKKSLTFNLVFQASERTLQDVEVDQIMQNIIDALKNELGARLR